MTKFPLIKFEGKTLEKLIETVSNGIGTLYEPVAIRKKAKAKAFELIVTERAKSQVLLEKNQEEYEEINRIEKRLWGKERKRQANIDKTVLLAANELKDVEDISDDPVNIDWATRFFNIVEDISDEFVLTLWGKILAGEIKEPQSFAFRTLESLKNLSTDEAKLFTKLSEFAIGNFNEAHIFYEDRNIIKDELDITFEDLLLLEETGLIKIDAFLRVKHPIPAQIESLPIKYQDKCIVLSNPKKVDLEFTYASIIYTSVGGEILKLIDPKSNLKYLQAIKKFGQSKGIHIKMADLHLVPNGFGGQNEREIPD